MRAAIGNVKCENKERDHNDDYNRKALHIDAKIGEGKSNHI